MPLSAQSRTQIEDAYRRMASEAHYRPEAPSDGFGNITVPAEELDLDAEARSYAERFGADEDSGDFHLGSANFEERPAMVFAVEAARLCCAGGSREFIRPLLALALDAVSEEK